MPHLGITTREGRCAICKKTISQREMVFFDASKSQGSHLAHKLCWETLLKERGRKPKDPKAPKVTQKSTEPLLPPF